MRSIKNGWILALSLFGAAPALANVVGADTQNFNPTTNGLDFVTVHSSETLQPGVFNFGFFLNYAVNTLPNYEGSTGDRTNFSDSLLSADLNMGVGVFRNFDVGLSIPQLVNQSVESNNAVVRGEFAETGLTEFRFNAKYRFAGDNSGGVAGIVSMNLNQIQDNPFAGSNPGPTINLELAADTTLSNNIAVAGNIGYRIRNPGEPIVGIPVEPLPNQYIFSGAISYLLTDYDTKLIGEIFGSVPAESQANATDRELSNLELLLGLKVDINPSLAWHVGAGTELINGTSSPDWRIYTGVNYAIGPFWGDGGEDRIVRVEDGQSTAEAMTATAPDSDIFAQVPDAKSETFVAKDVLFEFNSDNLSADFQDALRRMADYLKRGQFKSLTIEGHTDSVGSAAYNLDLSRRRAANVRQFMVSQAGLPSSKVKSVGYGEEKPIADNGNYQGRALNRRVEFRIQR